MYTNDTFLKRIEAYQNTTEFNNKIHAEFMQIVQLIPFLAEHRKHIEVNELGFGDTAFHYMWYLLIQHVAKVFSHPKLLEIGVFKGQVISLWSLIAIQLSFELSITGISPFKGNAIPELKWARRLKTLVSSQFRKDLASGNFYQKDDYRSIVEKLFDEFELPNSNLRLIEGYSNNSQVLDTVKNENFSLIYIDGDHTFDGVIEDIKNYCPLIDLNGFLVMDDASFYIPGNKFWKGHESVSRACEIIPSFGFKNVLNIGHNRIYQKVK